MNAIDQVLGYAGQAADIYRTATGTNTPAQAPVSPTPTTAPAPAPTAATPAWQKYAPWAIGAALLALLFVLFTRK